MPPTAESAVFREKHPNSWWWTPEIDFLSSILVTVQGANWQRGGGKGKAPSRIDRPKETPPKRRKPVSERMVAWRREQEDELERRRALRRKGVTDGS